jgi:hypothetical protein
LVFIAQLVTSIKLPSAQSHCKVALPFGAIAVVRRQFDEGRLPRLVGDYDTDNVSLKVVRIILSYTDFVNRVIWRKSG